MFVDRAEAGERLAPLLAHLRDRDPVVLGIPRGGVPVAAAVARALDAPLDIVVVRKLGAPAHPEFGVGAVGEDGVRVLDEAVVRSLGVTGIEAVESRERAEVTRRAALYRRGGRRLDLTGRTAIVIDDGVATGSTAMAACRVTRALGAGHVVLATPVAPRGWSATLHGEADELVAVETHSPFHAVALWYTDFRQTSDDEVIAALTDR